MADHNSFPPQPVPEADVSPEWYEDGIARTVVEYPPQQYAPGGTHNVFYDKRGDSINLFREEAAIDPSASPGMSTAVYRLSCDVADQTTGGTSRRYYYVSHDHGVILVDRNDGSPFQPVRLDRLPKQITIGAPLPAAEMSDAPGNPNRTVVVTSLLLFADQWRAGADNTGAEVRPSPFIADTLPEKDVPRGSSPKPNPIVAVLPLFREANVRLS